MEITVYAELCHLVRSGFGLRKPLGRHAYCFGMRNSRSGLPPSMKSRAFAVVARATRWSARSPAFG